MVEGAAREGDTWCCKAVRRVVYRGQRGLSVRDSDEPRLFKCDLNFTPELPLLHHQPVVTHRHVLDQEAASRVAHHAAARRSLAGLAKGALRDRRRALCGEVDERSADRDLLVRGHLAGALAGRPDDPADAPCRRRRTRVDLDVRRRDVGRGLHIDRHIGRARGVFAAGVFAAGVVASGVYARVEWGRESDRVTFGRHPSATAAPGVCDFAATTGAVAAARVTGARHERAHGKTNEDRARPYGPRGEPVPHRCHSCLRAQLPVAW